MTPEHLRDALVALATNLRWTWSHPTAHLLGELPGADPERHPLAAVTALTDDQLAALSADEPWCEEVAARLAELDAELADAVTDPDIAYFSPEFGISELVPQYSGGLGILAGDHLKAASDLGTSLGAVGLFYREGFFRQELSDGAQAERYERYEPTDLGAVDTGITVEIPIADRTVAAKVWRFDVGRVPLLVLDTDVAPNTAADRRITDRLYSGDRRHRLEQELVLGVGGARAVAAMGWSPGVHHLNEGHAGFLVLELLDRERTAGTATFAEAQDNVRATVLFTTHTPVPAGIDRFERSLVEPHLAPWAERWDHPVDDLLGLGEDPVEGLDVFNMAVLCLRLAGCANGVSRLHGEVSRGLFADVGGERIVSVTNGVHARTWVSPELQDLFDRVLGEGWAAGDPSAWSNADRLSDDEIVGQRHVTRAPLVSLLAERSGVELDPDALVIGFARRFATYKRATLLLRHPELLAGLLADDDRPVHLVFAGKAHPADIPGKQLLADVVAHGKTPAANRRFTFLPDYDIGVARAMYAGCDVWLNTPVRPHEASGTSGEKAALNGALNCSILDGWWAEMSDGRNGWDIPTADEVDDASSVGGAGHLEDIGADDDTRRDEIESASTLALLGEIAAEFHADGTGVPSAAWLDRMRHAWCTLGPQVTASRMVSDYQRTLYTPLLSRSG